jgi:hypothetical protein
MGARAEDLRDLPFDQMAGAGVFHLIANRDFATGFEETRDVITGGVVGNAAHRNEAAPGEGDVEQLGADLSVFEKHFVKVAQAEEQERVGGQFAFDSAILRHHGRELRVGDHHRNGSGKFFPGETNFVEKICESF